MYKQKYLIKILSMILQVFERGKHAKFTIYCLREKIE